MDQNPREGIQAPQVAGGGPQAAPGRIYGPPMRLTTLTEIPSKATLRRPGARLGLDRLGDPFTLRCPFYIEPMFAPVERGVRPPAVSCFLLIHDLNPYLVFPYYLTGNLVSARYSLWHLRELEQDAQSIQHLCDIRPTINSSPSYTYIFEASFTQEVCRALYSVAGSPEGDGKWLATLLLPGAWGAALRVMSRNYHILYVSLFHAKPQA